VRVLASTVHRVAPANRWHGFLVEIDWTAKEVLRLIEAPPLYARLGQRVRGGRRGLRGITRYAGRIWFASCDAMFGALPDTLALDQVITHPWMANIHEIEAAQDGIWVTATNANGIFLVGLDQQARRSAWLDGEPAYDMRIHLDKARNVYHVNTVFEKDGAVYAYCLKTGQVFRMLPGPIAEVAALEKQCHNVVMTEFGWFRNDSLNSRVLLGDQVIEVPRRGLAGQYTQPGWLRGMARLPNGNFLVGTSPASLYEIDPYKRQVVDEMRLSENVCWTVHGLYVDGGHAILRPPAEELRRTTRRFKQLTAYSLAWDIISTFAGRVAYKARVTGQGLLPKSEAD
jgi:hypothetical protein